MRKTTGIVLALFVAVLCTGFIMPQAGNVTSYATNPFIEHKQPRRIVSLAPALTEMLFALDAGSMVKGVTDYCTYPAAAKKIKKIGGFYDPNYEAIVGLRPDLVLLLPAHKDQRLYFQKLNIPTLTLDLNTISGIMSSFIQLGGLLQKEGTAAFWVHDFYQTFYVKTGQLHASDEKVMLVINRDYSQTYIRDVYIAGKGDFYDELLERLGVINVYTKTFPKYPKLSLEGLLRLDPDRIIELVANEDMLKGGKTRQLEAWQTVPGLRAAKENKVTLLAGDYLVVPGPRLPELFKALGVILRPEVQWESF